MPSRQCMCALAFEVRPGFLELWIARWCGPLIFCHAHSIVNEVEDPGRMVGAVSLEERLSVCERLLIVWNARSGLWWGTSLCGVVLYYWHCLWTSSGRPNFLDNGPPWGTGWCCCGRPLPSGPASSPLSILNASGSSCHTPAADVIESSFTSWMSL